MSDLIDILPLMISQYRYGEGSSAIYIEDRGNDTWAITNGSSCLNTDFQWEWESMPSSRTDDFLKRTRYTLKEAKDHLRKAIEKGIR